MAAQTFHVNIPQPVLDDLQQRLVRTRFTGEVDDAGWDYGTSLNYLKALVSYWQTQFDWRRQVVYR